MISAEKHNNFEARAPEWAGATPSCVCVCAWACVCVCVCVRACVCVCVRGSSRRAARDGDIACCAVLPARLCEQPAEQSCLLASDARRWDAALCSFVHNAALCCMVH